MNMDREPTGGFWTLDSQSPEELFVPDISELIEVWESYHDSDKEIVDIVDMYGVCELPDNQPLAVISLDLCEVLRQTGISLTTMYTADTKSTLHDYGSFYGDGLLGDRAQLSRELLLPELMVNNQVLPVPFFESIQAFLSRWKQSGVYIIANTSTLPGCEVSTCRFIAEYFPSSVNGILFPRNHDGKGNVTKADILYSAKETIRLHTGYELHSLPTIAIEDAYHHAANYADHSPAIEIFMPGYSWNEPLEGHTGIIRVEQQLGTIDTFIAVDEALRSHGIVK